MNTVNHSKLSYRRLFQIMLSRWYWILGSILLALFIAYLHLSITPYSYATQATLKFEDRKSEISELINIRNVYDRSNKLQSEQFVIRSRGVLLNAVKRLNYEVKYYEPGFFHQEELYPIKPFNVIILQKPNSLSDLTYNISPINTNQFMLEYERRSIKVKQTFKVGEIAIADQCKFKINSNFQENQFNRTYRFQIQEAAEVLARVNEGLSIVENKNTNILTFKQGDQNAVFAADALNAVLDEYLDYDKSQKTVSAIQTIAFIDTLILRLSRAVSLTGSNFEKFKSRSNMLSIVGSSNPAIAKLENLEKHLADLQLNQLRIEQLEKDLNGRNGQDIIALSIENNFDPYLNTLLTEYNALLMKRQELLATFKPSSETINETNNQIQIVKQSLVKNISAQKQKNEDALAFVTQQLNAHKIELKNIPSSEKTFVNLQAELEVNQKVYAYLNQKKLEAQISKASITPSAFIVDRASYQFNPVAPVKLNTYKLALLLGLLLGIGLIFTVRLLNPFIYDRETIELLTSIPVIGVIRTNSGSIASLDVPSLKKRPKSLFSESIRAIRTSISFLAPDISNKVICITSETSGEGKSFIAMHLAYALSMIDKRVVVIAADLRKPHFHEDFNADNQMGLSNYLSGQADFESILIYRPDNLSFIAGGPVPPNPSELLYSQKMDHLIRQLKERFDYVIIDSAPVGLVSDAVPIIKKADINLFIIRSGLSRYHAAAYPERLTKELQVENFQIILNAYNHDTLHTPYFSSNSYPAVRPYAEIAGHQHGYFENGIQRKWWKI